MHNKCSKIWVPVTHKQDLYRNSLPIVQYTFELGKQKIVFDFLQNLFCMGGGGGAIGYQGMRSTARELAQICEG